MRLETKNNYNIVMRVQLLVVISLRDPEWVAASFN